MDVLLHSLSVHEFKKYPKRKKYMPILGLEPT